MKLHLVASVASFSNILASTTDLLAKGFLNRLHGYEEFSWMLKERKKLVVEIEFPCRVIDGFGYNADGSYFFCVS